MICYDAALQRLRWWAPGVNPDDLRMVALAVECAAAHRATASMCDDPDLAGIAAEAEALAHELLRGIGVVVDLSPAAMCQPVR